MINLDKIFHEFRQNKQQLKIALNEWKTNPSKVRNDIAEMGTELTPAELREYCLLFQDLLEAIDEELL